MTMNVKDPVMLMRMRMESARSSVGMGHSGAKQTNVICVLPTARHAQTVRHVSCVKKVSHCRKEHVLHVQQIAQHVTSPKTVLRLLTNVQHVLRKQCQRMENVLIQKNTIVLNGHQHMDVLNVNQNSSSHLN